jgi:hypothetical protein
VPATTHSAVVATKRNSLLAGFIESLPVSSNIKMRFEPAS